MPLFNTIDPDNKNTVVGETNGIDNAREQIKDTDLVIEYQPDMIDLLNTRPDTLNPIWDNVARTEITDEAIAKEAKEKKVQEEYEDLINDDIQYVNENGLEVVL